LLSLVVIGVSIRYYREFFYLAFDEKSAFLSGIDTNRISLIFTLKYTNHNHMQMVRNNYYMFDLILCQQQLFVYGHITQISF
ncbi:hypothetical protein PT111_09005, partial [Erysipelothrix rhusiopathiae]|nr:hypothetical protein [Erysipelothrix rhusiopathiae]